MSNFKALYIILFCIGFELIAQSPNIWTKVYGGDYQDEALSCQQLPDSGFIVVGITEIDSWNFCDVLVLRLNSRGDTVWTKSIEVTPLKTQGAFSVTLTGDNSFILTGFEVENTHNVLCIKMDLNGQTIWARTYDLSDPLWKLGQCIVNTTDNGYVISGWWGDLGSGGHGVLLMKIDSAGNSLWYKSYLKYLDSDEEGYVVYNTQDGGYIIGVNINRWIGSQPDIMYVIKTDSNGDTLWTKLYGELDEDERFKYMYPTADSGYVLIGDKNDSLWILTIDNQGNTLMSKLLGLPDSKLRGEKIIVDHAGNFLISGRTFNTNSLEQKLILLKTKSSGDTIWTKQFNLLPCVYSTSLIETYDKGYFISGYYNSGTYPNNNYDCILIKTDSLGNANVITTINSEQNLIVTDFFLNQNYPNPFNMSTSIEYQISKKEFVNLTIYNTNGQIIKTLVNSDRMPGIYNVAWNGMNDDNIAVASGMYFYRLSAGPNRYITKKMLLLK